MPPRRNKKSNPKVPAERSAKKPLPAPRASKPAPKEKAPASAKRSARAAIANRIKQPFLHWKELRSKVEEQLAAAAELQKEIDQLLAEYRLGLTDLEFKARLVDKKVWQQRSLTKDLLTRAKVQTSDYPLVIRTNKALTKLDAQWTLVLEKQKELKATVKEAPKKLQFFNRMYQSRQSKSTAAAELAKRSSAINKGIAQIEDILKDLEKTKAKEENAITGSSGLLLPDQVLDNWKLLLGNIYKLESSRTANSDQILNNVELLRDVMLDSPFVARRVAEVESGFAEIGAAKDKLIAAGLMFEDQFAVNIVKLKQIVPDLFVTGQLDQLEQMLSELQSFVNEARINMARLGDPEVKPQIQTARDFQTSLTDANNLDMVLELARSFGDSLDARDPYMKGHSERVSQIAVNLAKAMNWKDSDIEYLSLASLLHDIGKIRIPEAVLKKRSLQPKEMELIRQHPFYGAQILQPIRALQNLAPTVFHHQEFWNGLGYPSKISKKDIPISARLIAAAEAFDVMTAEIPFRKRMSVDQALDVVKAEAGKQFDPEVTEALEQVIKGKDKK